jgi:protein required for attachment to host cells
MVAVDIKREWILVASREEVRVYARRGIGPLSLQYDIGNPTGALKPQDLESDSPGRCTDNQMRARHAYSTQESAKERALRDFYREVLDTVQHALFEHRFDTLTLIAEPKLLGILRHLLSDGLKRVLVREIPKDLSYEPEDQIRQRLMQG